MMMFAVSMLADVAPEAQGLQSLGSSWIALWCVAGLAAFILGTSYAGTEIGIFSLSKIRLRLRVAKQDANALQLNEWLRNPTYALEGLLISQNLMSFIFTLAVTNVLALQGFSETARALISIAIVTPMALVLGDIMPKDLFYVHANSWMYCMAPLVKWQFRVITVVPLLPIVHVLARWSTRVMGSEFAGKRVAVVGPRAEILTLFQESAATGMLTGTQQDLVQRALRLARISVKEVMIPWNRVVGVPSVISREGFRALVKRYNVSRLPVLGRSTTEVLGIVDVMETLAPATKGTGGGGAFKLSAHLHPVMTLIAEQNVRSATTLMQRARQTIAVVVDLQNRAIGLVTMKDLIEELVGDLESW
ncbi:MAG: CNNM domain-containing protein [Phycisphaerales bacterium]|nr:CNNM domain-containing protein [Phycisphaerales bacterium]